MREVLPSSPGPFASRRMRRADMTGALFYPLSHASVTHQPGWQRLVTDTPSFASSQAFQNRSSFPW